jgi:hypothetical protein
MALDRMDERGELVTFAGKITTARTAIPPALVFQNVNFKMHFLAGALTSSLTRQAGTCQKFS